MGNITLYHNTSNQNAVSISKEGIKGGLRLNAYGKGSEAEGAGIWCTTTRGYGYGGATITFEIDESDKDLIKQNDTEFIVYRDIAPEDIIDIDLVVSSIPCNTNRTGNTVTVESDLPEGVKRFGKEKLLNIFKRYENKFVEPYNYNSFVNLVETGNKLLKGKVQLTESKKLEEDTEYDIFRKIQAINKNAKWDNYKNMPKNKMLGILYDMQQNADRYKNNSNKKDKSDNKIKPDKVSKEYTDNPDELEEIDNNEHKSFDIQEKTEKNESKILTEAGRNELLALTKSDSITRYNKAAGYKGFSLVDIDTNSIMVRDSIVITNKVGNYYDTIELEDILYWVGLYVEESKDKKMGIKIAEKALVGAADGMDIKIDCSCPDFAYRFAYQATILQYKYGKPENRPTKITNPNNLGALCKHLTAMLSNKQWLRQVASTLNDWVIENIEWVRKYLNVSEEDFQLPDELARELGRHGAYAKFIDKNIPQEDEEEQDDEDLEEIDDADDDNNNNNNNSNNNNEDDEDIDLEEI